MHVILSYSRCVKTMWIVSSASAPGVRFLLSIVNNGVIHVGFGGRPGLTNKQSRESVALTLPPEQTGKIWTEVHEMCTVWGKPPAKWPCLLL
ncbi:hypothetical protein BRADI_2g16785v3 [Brachypodium distachyon]|uniref:Uncharacterized protein n=1 Tax=Brachypodium distachyon TaxID=15368 RepID=A0A2K2D8W6_BRADI|nr:hypothetical protein BRADI_2g16785v3 [Brachypodium distachyon]